MHSCSRSQGMFITPPTHHAVVRHMRVCSNVINVIILLFPSTPRARASFWPRCSTCCSGSTTAAPPRKTRRQLRSSITLVPQPPPRCLRPRRQDQAVAHLPQPSGSHRRRSLTLPSGSASRSGRVRSAAVLPMLYHCCTIAVLRLYCCDSHKAASCSHAEVHQAATRCMTALTARDPPLRSLITQLRLQAAVTQQSQPPALTWQNASAHLGTLVSAALRVQQAVTLPNHPTGQQQQQQQGGSHRGPPLRSQSQPQLIQAQDPGQRRPPIGKR